MHEHAHSLISNLVTTSVILTLLRQDICLSWNVSYSRSFAKGTHCRSLPSQVTHHGVPSHRLLNRTSLQMLHLTNQGHIAGLNTSKHIYKQKQKSARVSLNSQITTPAYWRWPKRHDSLNHRHVAVNDPPGSSSGWAGSSCHVLKRRLKRESSSKEQSSSILLMKCNFLAGKDAEYRERLHRMNFREIFLGNYRWSYEFFIGCGTCLTNRNFRKRHCRCIRGIGYLTFLFLKTLLTPELQNLNNRKGEIATKAELEINSWWTLIKLAYYLYDSMRAN